MMISKSIWNSHAAHHMKREPLLLLLESTYKLTHSAGRVRSWSLVLRVASRYTTTPNWYCEFERSNFPFSFIHCNHVNYSYILPHHHHHVCHLSCVPTLLWTYECVGYFWRLKWFNSIHSRCHLINMENGKSKSEVGLTHTRRRRKCPFMIRQIVSTFRGRISDSIIIILTRSNVPKFNIIDHKLTLVLSDHTLVLSA